MRASLSLLATAVLLGSCKHQVTGPENPPGVVVNPLTTAALVTPEVANLAVGDSVHLEVTPRLEDVRSGAAITVR